MKEKETIKIFTWHVHGSYLYYLSQGNYVIYIPVDEAKSNGYAGRGETFPFGANVIEVEAEDVKNLELDLILFQDDDNYLLHQYEILSEHQRTLPKIYLEHDPPWGHPTDTLHLIQDPEVLVVHVTHFNKLMWDNGVVKTEVIEHGVMPLPVNFEGNLDRGIVVINNLPSRGRLLGYDIFQEVKKSVPLDLVGMGTQDYGIGEVLHSDLPAFASHYRFFFNPIRYTSLGLAVLEAMMLGIPVIGFATTEMSVTIENGKNGFIHTDVNYLIDKMKLLLKDPDMAKEIGEEGRQTALRLFNIERFTQDWQTLFEKTITTSAFNTNTYENNSIY